jgi:hypothetical protein
MRKRYFAVAVLAIVALAASPGAAGAHKAKYKSIVEIDSYLFIGAFNGTVGSFDNKRCSANRVVAVWKRNPGAMDGPFGTAKTGKGGAWRLNVTAPSGNYYATVKPRRLKAPKRKRKHKHICRGARSSNFGIP